MSHDPDSGRPQWTMSDSWVLAAIAHLRPPSPHTLMEVITKADIINHDILTESEFTQAIGRLLSADLIGADADADRYWLTQAGAKIRER